MRQGRIRSLAALILGAGVVWAAEPSAADSDSSDKPAMLPPVELVVPKAPVEAPHVVAATPPAAPAPLIVPPNISPISPPQSPAVAATKPPCGNFLPEPCAVCCQKSPRFWMSADYMLWWIPSEHLNSAIFTLGPNGAGRGALGQPGTIVLYGASPINFDAPNGIRLHAGYWLSSDHTFGIEASAFLLEHVGNFFEANTGANDFLGLHRSVLVTAPGSAAIETTTDVTNPPTTTGGVAAAARSRLWGADTDLTVNLRDHCGNRIDGLVGFRYLDLAETLNLDSDTRFAAGPVADQHLAETFDTRNQFYGPEVGGRYTKDCGRFSFITTAKVGLGVMHESLDVLGATTYDGLLGPHAFGPFPGPNGHFVRDRFVAVPDVGLKVAYRLTDNIFASLGYDFVYVSDVLRPGDQIQRDAQPVGAGLVLPPAPVIHTDYFVNGLSLGLGITY